MNDFQYILEPYEGMKSRYSCPECRKPKKYTRYIDTETGNHLPERYGKCERMESCGYHLNPYKDRYRQAANTKRFISVPMADKPRKRGQVMNIPQRIFRPSLGGYERNSFIQYLKKLLGETSTRELIERFKIGTSKYWKGATVFWLIDEQGHVAGGQVILFDELGKTKRKALPNGSTKRYNGWVHTALKRSYESQGKPLPDWLQTYIEQPGKARCLFGLPQLKHEPITKPIAIVEAAKTAIIATAYLPQYIWLAVGALNWLNESRLEAVKGRKIALFPDKGVYEDWEKRAIQLSHVANFTVSDLLERKGAKPGSDLADYLTQLEVKDFRPKQAITLDQPTTIQNQHEEKAINPINTIKAKSEYLLNGMLANNPVLGTLIERFSLTIE